MEKGCIRVVKKIIHQDIIYIKANELLNVIKHLKYHTQFRNTQLINITRVDFPRLPERFTVIYIFNNPYIGRFIMKVKRSEMRPVESINKYFPNRIWYEREVWDLFGIFFLNNPNLRRILNDYGFEGHPFRKDYPLTGYNQLQYDITKKRLISTNIELRQQFR